MKYVIGIDIGGTNLRIGTVDAEGRLMNFERKSSASLVSEDAVKILEAKSGLTLNAVDSRVRWQRSRWACRRW